MGRIYLSTHTEIEKKMAVKVLHPSFGRMPDVVSRFRQEARAASRIGHPHIVEVYDSGSTEDGSIYFVMEHLSGIDLGGVLSSEGKLPVERTLRLAVQICEAVAAAHDAGIIHRDLKPENLFIAKEGRRFDIVKVLDFGIAKVSGEASANMTLTKTGVAFISQEQDLHVVDSLGMDDRKGRGHFSIGAASPAPASDQKCKDRDRADEPRPPTARHERVADLRRVSDERPFCWQPAGAEPVKDHGRHDEDVHQRRHHATQHRCRQGSIPYEYGCRQ